MLSGLNADLNQCAVNQEKQWDAYNLGGPWCFAGMAEATSSINVGTLTVDSCSPAAKQLVWRRTATKTLEASKDPQKNQEKLNKAVAKTAQGFPAPTKEIVEVVARGISPLLGLSSRREQLWRKDCHGAKYSRFEQKDRSKCFCYGPVRFGPFR